MKRTRCSAVIKCFMKPMTQIICINYNDLLVNSKPLLSTRLSNLLIETDWFQLNWLNASEMVTVTTISTTIWLRYFGTFSPHCLLFLLLFAIVVDLFRSISLSFSCKHLTTKCPFKLNRLWITFRLIANKKGNKWSAPKNQKKNRFNSFPHFFRCFFFVLFCLFVFICYFKWWAVRENKQTKKRRDERCFLFAILKMEFRWRLVSDLLTNSACVLLPYFTDYSLLMKFYTLLFMSEDKKLCMPISNHIQPLISHHFFHMERTQTKRVGFFLWMI